MAKLTEYKRFKRSGLLCIIGTDEDSGRFNAFVGLSRGHPLFGRNESYLNGIIPGYVGWPVTFAGDHVGAVARFPGVWWIGLATELGHSSKPTAGNALQITTAIIKVADEVGQRDPVKDRLAPDVQARLIHPTAAGQGLGAPGVSIAPPAPPYHGPRRHVTGPPGTGVDPTRDERMAAAVAARAKEAATRPRADVTPRTTAVHVKYDGTGWVVEAGDIIRPFRFAGHIAAEQYAEQVAEQNNLKVVVD